MNLLLAYLLGLSTLPILALLYFAWNEWRLEKRRRQWRQRPKGLLPDYLDR